MHLLRRSLLAVAVLTTACGQAGSIGTAVSVPVAAREAVTSWIGHLAAHDDPGAFSDLAPASRAAVGDLANYRRGSGRFGGVYARFSVSAAELLKITDNLAVVTLRLPGSPPPTAAVPVRKVAVRWLVDPILDAGSYSLRPDDGATVGPRPTVRTRLDDAATRARVWFDGSEAVAETHDSFRPRLPLTPGWHVATIVLLRGHAVVARTLSLQVSPTD